MGKYNVGSKKCSAPVFHCSVGWPTGDSRGGRDLATEGSPLVDSSGAQWGRPGEAPIGPINVSDEVYVGMGMNEGLKEIY